MSVGGAEGPDARSERVQREAAEFANAVLALLAVARRTRGRLQPLFDDVTVPQLVLLDAVEVCGIEGIGAVSAYTLLTQPTVTQQAAALEAAGLIERASSGHDRRRRILTLTERGEQLLAAKRTVVSDRLSSAWESLDDAERAVAAPLLRHLADLIADLT
ncbi:MarR family winged helix-turn-helix transcriptional regulator [Nocardioides sp.]|uniref:MarR family winged helix-turn-helix transcriptional regulator n=1 Tax=Nocardioides sp. TaxID=35761 RepID=UPI0026274912|nr:MarR family winged helix-turn-helix transcriptional regulator [Nocardioides sp.]MDI6912506.1 MarR family winged helix-turn-helix transcriptional regulator [Nocardioides sp.]